MDRVLNGNWYFRGAAARSLLVVVVLGLAAVGVWSTIRRPDGMEVQHHGVVGISELDQLAAPVPKALHEPVYLAIVPGGQETVEVGLAGPHVGR